MQRNSMILRLILVLLVGGLGWLFVVQNTGTVAVLGLNLGVAAWKFVQPQPVALLLLGAFSLGMLIGGLAVGIRASGNTRRAQRLERELAMTGSVEPQSFETEDGWD